MRFSSVLKYKLPVLYGLAMAVLLFLLKWLELRFIIFDHAFEIYIGGIALIFTALGIWLAKKLTSPATVIIEKQVLVPVPATQPFQMNETALEQTGISKREMDVLELMARGMSNQEIAGELFVSLSTVKTHTASIFEKLEVKRRTQAVEKARSIRLIP